MSKRTRTDGGMSKRQQRARMASMAIARKYPYSEYGRIMHKRGTEAGLARFGESYRSASQSQRANRKAAGYYGRGEYYGKKAGRWLAERTGIPGAGAVGEFLGDHAGDWVKKNIIPSWLGGGLYEPSFYSGRGGYNTNSLISGSVRAPPSFGSVNDETGALIVSHREYVGDIFGPEQDARDFKNRVYEINPGIERTFPWLSQIAQNYEEYEMGQCVFEFKSTVDSSVAGDGQVGTIVMVTNYNSAAREFDDKNTMMQYDGSNSCRTTAHAIHGVECDPAKLSGAAGHYVRVKPKAGQDLKTYDHGLFQLATVGMPANFDNATIGELWVSYTVKLRKPRLFSGRGLNLSRDMYLANNTGTGNSSLQGLDFAKADTNNIGTKIQRVATAPPSPIGSTGGTFYDITFPPSFSGSVEVKIMMTGNLTSTWDSDDGALMAQRQIVFGTYAGAGDGHGVDDNVSNLTAGEPWATDQVVSSTDSTPVRGNIEPIKDIFASFPGAPALIQEEPRRALEPNWCAMAFQAKYNVSDSSSFQQHTEDHFVAVAHVRIGVATQGRDNILRVLLPATSSTGDHRSQWLVDISEYNTFDLPLSRPYPTFSSIDGRTAKDPLEQT